MNNEKIIMADYYEAEGVIRGLKLLINDFNFTSECIEKLAHLEKGKLYNFLNLKEGLGEEELSKIFDIIFEFKKIIDNYYINGNYPVG